jgi:hypothetical protein
MHRREYRYPRRPPTLLSPLILGRGGDLRVPKIRFRGDVHRNDLSHLHHSKNQLRKLDRKLGTPLKRQLNLKLRWSLKDPILKMEIPMHRAHTIALEDRNAPAQSLWEITMSGKTIMRRSPLIMWNLESHIKERPLLSTYILPQNC